jgi:hypothetical protein
MVAFPTTGWSSIDSEISTAPLCTAARTTTVASTSLRLKAAQRKTQQKSNRQAPVSCLLCLDRTHVLVHLKYGFVILSKVIL